MVRLQIEVREYKLCYARIVPFLYNYKNLFCEVTFSNVVRLCDLTFFSQGKQKRRSNDFVLGMLWT